MPKDTVEQVKIAVDEACANVIKHAYKGGEGLPIDVSVIVEQDHCTVSIRDQGESFRPNDYTMPDIFEAARQRRHGGFGVQIMRRLMDQVEYRSQGRTNEVCLTKYFSRTNGDSNH